MRVLICAGAIVFALAGCNEGDKAGSAGSNTTPSGQNQAPTIYGTPPSSAKVGASFSFQPGAADPNGDRLSFSIAGQPAWTHFDPATGRLEGMPSSHDEGTFSGISIRVSDGSATASLPAFNLTVSQNGAVAPTISGRPPAATVVGMAYRFQPTAFDANGDALTFSIQNKPSWASFDDSTGRLMGTPGVADVGIASNIVISAGNRSATASLQPFAIAVMQTASGAATVSWTPPTANTDGTALTDLAGYRIYYGTDQSILDRMIDVANAGLSTFVVSNLPPATWYFSIKAYNSAQVESDFSNLASKLVP